MVATRKVILILLGILALLAFLIFLLRGFVYPRISLPDKYKIVRYYACVYAICTKGCGHDWLDVDENNPNDIGICVERDPTTKKCLKSCQDVCEEMNWNNICNEPEKCCNQNYNITVNLEGEALLKGIYDGWVRGAGFFEAKTEIVDILQELNKSEKFPSIELFGTTLDDYLIEAYSEYAADCYYASNGICFNQVDCVCLGPMYALHSSYNFSNLPAFGPILPDDFKFCGGVVDKYARANIGVGAIILPSQEAREKFGCTDRPVKKIDTPGFYSCVFKGPLIMWALGNDLNKGKDVVIVSKHLSDHFFITAEPPEQIKPVNNWATYKVTIVNHIYSAEETEFELKLTYPENVECKWENEDSDSTRITLKNNTQDSLNFVCRANQPEKKYEIKIKAKGKIYEDWASVILSSTTYEIDCLVQDCEIEVYANKENIRKVVRITNNLGFDATFKLELEQDDVLNCEFVGGNKVSIPSEGYADISINCMPKPEAEGGSYAIKISSSLEGYNLVKSKKITVVVKKCKGPTQLQIIDPISNIQIEKIAAGNKVKLYVYAEGCEGVSVKIYGTNEDYKDTDYEIFSSSLSVGSYSWSVIRRVSTPGTYTFYAWVDINGNKEKDEGEVDSKNLTVGKAELIPNECKLCNEKCIFFNSEVCYDYIFYKAYGEICDRCTGDFFNPVEPCTSACDPQSCKMSTGKCAEYSNVCCISGDETYYSNGPGIPCFSEDNLNELKVTKNFWWGGYNCNIFGCWFTVREAKNILVKDDKYAVFENDWPGSKDECRGIGGPNPSNPPEHLSSATLTTISTPTGNHNACKLSDNLPPYSTWMYIRISATSRPVYGVIISIYLDPQDCHFYPPSVTTRSKITYSNFHLFLHSQSGWFKAGTISISAENKTNKTIKILPDEFAWKNIDAILIAHAHTYDLRQCERSSGFPGVPPLPYTEIEDVNAYIDYVGLLTADKERPFCTEGRVGEEQTPYHRVVNDASTCYWGVDCPLSRNGWKYKGVTSYTGFLEECRCRSGESETCGYGYCEREVGGNKFCFSRVRCASGGWTFLNFEKCGPEQVCTREGCK